MKYKKGSTFPYTESTLRADNPRVSFPANALTDASVRTDYGIVEVQEVAMPVQAGYNAVAGDPAGDPVKEVWNLVVKDVSEVSSDEITFTTAAPPSGNSYLEGPPEFIAGSPYGHWQGTWVYTQESGVEARLIDYGAPIDQIEFITENSLKDWKDKVEAIKLKYPK